MNEFSQAVKMARLADYPTAKKFWREHQKELDCSYPMYMAIEKGTVPSLALAVKIIETLSMDEESSLFAWMRVSLPDPRLEAISGKMLLRMWQIKQKQALHRRLCLKKYRSYTT